MSQAVEILTGFLIYRGTCAILLLGFVMGRVRNGRLASQYLNWWARRLGSTSVSRTA